MSEASTTLLFSSSDVTFTNMQWSNKLLNSLEKMRQDNIFCDVTLEVPVVTKDDKILKLEFTAHTCLLAAASELFNEILDKEVQQRHVIMTEFEEDALRHCLSYIYGQQIKVPFDRISSLKKASETLQLKSLATQCGLVEKALSDKVTAELLKGKKKSTTAEKSSSDTGAETDAKEPMETSDPRGCDTTNNCGEPIEEKASPMPEKEVYVKVEKMDEGDQREVFENEEFQDEQIKQEDDDDEEYTPTTSRRSKRKLTRSHQCENCDSYFSSAAALRKHMKNVCKIAVETSITKEKLTEEDRRIARNQSRAKLEKKEYNCKECGEVFVGFKRLFRHRRMVHEKLFVCQHCEKVYATEKELTTHVGKCKQNPDKTSKTETGEEEKNENDEGEKKPKAKRNQSKQWFMCDHCGCTFATKMAFTKHMEKHAADPSFSSGKRSKQTYEEFRKKHNALRAKYEKNEYPCKDCGEMFIGFKKLYVHRQKVHKKQHSCQYCNKVFEYPALLKVHEKRHRNEKEFLCSQCDYRACTSHEVRFHEEREHLNLQMQCKYCQHVFRNTQALRSHESLHRRGPVKCKYCDYATMYPTSLKMHVINKHFPEKRELLSCEICRRSFTQRGHLNKHLKSVHGKQLAPLVGKRLGQQENEEAIVHDSASQVAGQVIQEGESVSAIDPQTGQEYSEIYGIQYATPPGEQVQLGQSLERNNIIHETQSASENLVIQEVDELEGVVYYYVDDVNAQRFADDANAQS